jgi:lipocalin
MALQKTTDHNNSGVTYDYHRIDGGEFTVTPQGITATFRVQGYLSEQARAEGKAPVTTRWIRVGGDHTFLAYLYEVLKTAPEMEGAIDADPDEWKIDNTPE